MGMLCYTDANRAAKAGIFMPGFELKKGARKLMRDNAPKLFFISILYIVIVNIMSYLQFYLPGTEYVYQQYLEQLAAGKLLSTGAIYSYFRPSGIPLVLALWLLTPVLDAGFMSFCLKTARGSKGEYKYIFDGFLFFGKVILIRIITAIFTILWSLLFFFPGIVAYYRYSQAYYILLDDPGKGALECISESKQLMRGKKLDLFLLDLSFIGWWALNIVIVLILPVSLPVLSIWLTPYFGLTHASYYDWLIGTLA